jgi:hypothetical protein
MGFSDLPPSGHLAYVLLVWKKMEMIRIVGTMGIMTIVGIIRTISV